MKYLIQQQIEQGIISHNKKLDEPTKDYKAQRLYIRLNKAKSEKKQQNIKDLIRQHFHIQT